MGSPAIISCCKDLAGILCVLSCIRVMLYGGALLTKRHEHRCAEEWLREHVSTEQQWHRCAIGCNHVELQSEQVMQGAKTQWDTEFAHLFAGPPIEWGLVLSRSVDNAPNCDQSDGDEAYSFSTSLSTDPACDALYETLGLERCRTNGEWVLRERRIDPNTTACGGSFAPCLLQFFGENERCIETTKNECDRIMGCTLDTESCDALDDPINTCDAPRHPLDSHRVRAISIGRSGNPSPEQEAWLKNKDWDWPPKRGPPTLAIGIDVCEALDKARYYTVSKERTLSAHELTQCEAKYSVQAEYERSRGRNIYDPNRCGPKYYITRVY